MLAREFSNVLQTPCFNSNFVAKAFAITDLLIARAALVAAFIGLLVFGNMAATRLKKTPGKSGTIL